MEVDRSVPSSDQPSLHLECYPSHARPLQEAEQCEKNPVCHLDWCGIAPPCSGMRCCRLGIDVHGLDKTAIIRIRPQLIRVLRGSTIFHAQNKLCNQSVSPAVPLISLLDKTLVLHMQHGKSCFAQYQRRALIDVRDLTRFIFANGARTML